MNAGFSEHPIEGVDGRDLRLRVWRPPGSAGALPTLLMLDGQYLNSVVGDILPTLDGPPILVASLGFNSSERTIIAPWRARDYTPRGPGDSQCDPRMPAWPCGGADTLLGILERDVLPFLAERYGAAPDRRALFGHSYAGLFSLYALLHKPGLFSRVYAASPSLWWYWPHMLSIADDAPAWREAPHRLPALEVLVGDEERWRPKPAREGLPREPGVSTIPFAEAFLAALHGRGMTQATLRIVPGQAHGPMLAWSARHCLEDFQRSLSAP